MGSLTAPGDVKPGGEGARLISFGSPAPALLPLRMHLAELALHSRPLRSIGHIGRPLAKLVLSMPQMFAVFTE